MDYGNTQRCDLLYTPGITAASCGGENSRHTWLLRVCFPELTVVFQEHMLPHSTCSTLVARFRLAYFTFHLMISYFFKVFQFFAALCFNRHLLTFWILACLHTARHAPHRHLIHLICFVPTACVSGAAQKMYTFASENFVCVCICKLEFACPPTEFICNEEYSSNRFLTPIPSIYTLFWFLS